MTVERGGRYGGAAVVTAAPRRNAGNPAFAVHFFDDFRASARETRACVGIYVRAFLRACMHVNGSIAPFGWVVDGWRCCAGDANGGRAVTAGGGGTGW